MLDLITCENIIEQSLQGIAANLVSHVIDWEHADQLLHYVLPAAELYRLLQGVGARGLHQTMASISIYEYVIRQL